MRQAFDTPHGSLILDGRCQVMGVLNVTPDSFSDGGRYLDPAAAISRARQMAAEGADVIDVGGESTRPGAAEVHDEEQIHRVIPVIEGLRDAGVALPVSIDTRSAQVAARALDAGADFINDVSAARHDSAMAGLLAERRVPFVVMHMQGTPATMQNSPRYADVVREVAEFFDRRTEVLAKAGVDVARMIVDPGIGFGKTLHHNLKLILSVGEFTRRWSVMVGASRKAFLGELLGEADPGRRLPGTVIVSALCAMQGAAMVRVHDVGPVRQAIDRLTASGPAAVPGRGVGQFTCAAGDVPGRRDAR